ncbi:MAG: DNA polymerase III subunit beta [Gemmatimonadetes bacterium]|jgi:DNA polymerase-3 subunit beta|nr:DNA polymerase III subunit beta [Gemmatimonadota bacterium]
MKFTITRENLQEGLAAVAGSIPTRTTLPVLANILLEAEDDAVRMSGTDLDTAVSIRIPAEVQEEGSITAPARKLQEIARELAPAPVNVTTQADAISLVSGRSKFRLNGLPKDEFPAFPGVSFDTSWKLSGRELQQMIAHVSFAASTEETRPILNGVLWQLQENEMRMVATNGHRLAKMTLPRGSRAPDGATGDLIVHPRALDQVQKLLGGSEEVEVARSENHLGFRGDGVQIYTRLIEGPYPNYEQVIPKDNDKTLVAEKTALNAAIRRMAIVASDQTHRIRLSLGGPMLRFAVQTPDLGEATEELPVEYDGEPLEIGFNASYLLELLRYMPSDEVRLSFKAPERAATMEPVGNEDTPDLLCLVMPLRLLD